MLSNADNFVYLDSMQDKKVKYPVLRKRLIYQNDSNSGNYNTNTITFDLSQMANLSDGSLIDFSNSEVQIPLVYTIQSPTAVAGPLEGQWDYKISPKNAFGQIIHSANITYSNREVLSASASYLNAIMSFRALTTFSKSDVAMYGQQCLYALDSEHSWQYNFSDVADTTVDKSRCVAGNGVCNNWVLPTFCNVDSTLVTAVPLNAGNKFLGSSSTSDVAFGNQGLLQRMRFINDKVDAPATLGVFDQCVHLVRNKNQYNIELKNYATALSNPSANNSYQSFLALLSIPLKFISPFFQALPLCRSAYIKMQLTLNTGYVVVKCPATAATTISQYVSSEDIGFQNTCPVQIAPRINGANHSSATTSFMVTCNVVNPLSVSVSGFTNPSTQANKVSHPLGSCRVTAVVYELDPDMAMEYLSRNTAKTIEWETYSTNILTNVASGNTVDYMISNGTNSVTGVLAIPWVSKNGAVDATTLATSAALINPFAEPRSPFSCSPNQCVSATFNSAQVLVGGKSILSDNPITYDYEAFMLNLRELGKISGITGLNVAEGISKDAYESCYRFLYAINRDVDSKANVSVQIKFQNGSLLAHDYLFVLFLKRSMTINVANGMVIE